MSQGTSPRTKIGKQVAVYFLTPGRQSLHASFVIDHEPGSLAHLLEKIPTPGLNMIHLEVSNGTEEAGGAHGHIYAEADRSIVPSELEATLRTAQGVRYVKVEAGIDKLLVDTSYPLSVARGPDGLLLIRSHMARMLEQVRQALGSGGALLLYEQGHLYGKQVWGADIGAVGLSYARENLPYLLHVYSALGWGRTELIEARPDRGEALLRIHDSFECSAQTSPIPYSQFLRGHLAGLFEILAERPVTCEEVRCIAKGDPACEFRLSPSARTPPSSDALGHAPTGHGAPSGG